MPCRSGCPSGVRPTLHALVALVPFGCWAAAANALPASTTIRVAALFTDRVRLRLMIHPEEGTLFSRVAHFWNRVSEKSLERLLLHAHPHAVHQVDGTRLRQDRVDRHMPFANQIRGPEMTRAP